MKKFFKKVLLLTWTIITLYLVSSYINTPKYEVYFSPDNNPRQKIVDLIANTKKSLILAMYTMSDDAIGNELLKAKKRGVKVQIITDKSSMESKWSKIPNLKEQGVEVLYYPTSIMHHKFAVFDHKTVCLGSLNWTKSGCKRNQENILITNNSEVRYRYEQQFQCLKERCK